MRRITIVNFGSLTAKRILERLVEYRLHHHLSKFDRSVFLILKSIIYFLAYVWLVFFFFYLQTIGVRLIFIWWLSFEKKPFQFWHKTWIQVLVTLLLTILAVQAFLNLSCWCGDTKRKPRKPKPHKSRLLNSTKGEENRIEL